MTELIRHDLVFYDQTENLILTVVKYLDFLLEYYIFEQIKKFIHIIIALKLLYSFEPLT